MYVCAGVLGDVTGVGTGNTAAGIQGRTAAAGIFADVCGLCALVLDGTRQFLVVQIFANWSGDTCVLAMRLRWAELRRICGGVAHACVRLCLAVI